MGEKIEAGRRPDDAGRLAATAGVSCGGGNPMSVKIERKTCRAAGRRRDRLFGRRGGRAGPRLYPRRAGRPHLLGRPAQGVRRPPPDDRPRPCRSRRVGRDRKKWGIPEFGADVKAVVDAEKAEQVIIFGNSLGGPVAIEAALLLPGRVLGVVGVDTFQRLERR